MGSQRVRQDWATSLSLFTFMHWRRKWQPTPGLLPGESQGREPGGLPSVGLHRVGLDWSYLAAAAAAANKGKRQRFGSRSLLHSFLHLLKLRHFMNTSQADQGAFSKGTLSQANCLTHYFLIKYILIHGDTNVSWQIHLSPEIMPLSEAKFRMALSPMGEVSHRAGDLENLALSLAVVFFIEGRHS